MTHIWLLVCMSRQALIRRAMQLTRNFRDLLSDSDVVSIADYAMVKAAKKFEPERGRFRTFAKKFVDRAILKAVKQELKWRAAIAELRAEDEPIDPKQHAETDARVAELQHCLGDDYEVFISHFAWSRSMRDISRVERRSIRSVQKSLRRACRSVYARFGFITPAPRVPRRH